MNHPTDKASRRVEQRKKAQQFLLLRECELGLDLENLVDHRGARGADEYEQRQMTQVGELRQKTGPGIKVAGGLFPGGARRSASGFRLCRINPQSRCMAQRTGSIKMGFVRNAPMEPPMSAPTIPPPAICPMRFLAVCGSKRSFTIDQKPEISMAPNPLKCR